MSCTYSCTDMEVHTYLQHTHTFNTKYLLHIHTLGTQICPARTAVQTWRCTNISSTRRHMGVHVGTHVPGVAARKLVWADPSLRYTSTLVGALSNQQKQLCVCGKLEHVCTYMYAHVSVCAGDLCAPAYRQRDNSRHGVANIIKGTKRGRQKGRHVSTTDRQKQPSCHFNEFKKTNKQTNKQKKTVAVAGWLVN